MRKALLLTLVLFAAAAFAELPPLIPRAAMWWGRDARWNVQISPDGTKISWLTDADAKTTADNVWVQTIGKEDAHVVTSETRRDIETYRWAPDSRHVLYFMDNGGDEDEHLFLADLDGDDVRDLTPFRGVKATNLLTSEVSPHEILVGMNRRDRRLFDMYRVNLESGAVTLEAQNPGDVLSWRTDSRFVIRGATAFDLKTGRTTVRVRDDAKSEWRELISWPFENTPVMFGQVWGGSMIVNFPPDGKTVNILTSAAGDTLQVVSLDLATGKPLAVLASDPKSDPMLDASLLAPTVLVSPVTQQVQAVAYEYLVPEWKVLDAPLRDDFARLTRELGGFPLPVSRDAADAKWIVNAVRSDQAPVFYLYDRAQKKATKLFASQPELEQYTLATAKPVVIRSRDGLDLVSYLTLPAGVAPRNLPLIVFPHGGPFIRDHAAFDWDAQLLANRGYAVLQVNYRGSEGFGRRFTNAFTRQWGLATHDDLVDAIRWTIAQGIADPKRIAAMGASGGGYATLNALTRDPDLFVCGVSMVGPANVRTLIESFPPYWGPSRERFLRRVGDVIHDDAFNRKISPFFNVDRIKAPLLVQQGANDPRVHIDQVDAMVKALRDAKREVTYVVYPDEGHGFGRTENILDFLGRAEEFLAKHLGGRAEPWKEVPGASAEVR